MIENQIIPVPGYYNIDGVDHSDIPQVDIKTTVEEVKNRLLKGTGMVSGKTILHTGPHHDDIMLGIMPLVNRQLRDHSNKVHFAVLTSGFTAISNKFLITTLEHTLKLIKSGEIQMIEYPDFFKDGYLFKWDKDVNHYLNKVAKQDEEGKKRGLCHRITRCLVEIYRMNSVEELILKIESLIQTISGYYEGEKNSPDIQLLKGMIREFEEELVWAHSGKLVRDIHHLRLGFYKGDIFTEQPEEARDVKPVLDLLRRINPDIISVTMDPEGSGPDTHFKVLQAIAEALRLWKKERDLSKLKIHAYRNVWYRYDPSEANIYAPVSLNSMAILQNSFRQCYLSQVDASFPSPELNGPFCDLAQKIWVEQFGEIQLLLGKDYFYQNDIPLIRATHGLIFYREIDLDEFLKEARRLEKVMD
jgi:glucosamine-6-phosphate deaminase